MSKSWKAFVGAAGAVAVMAAGGAQAADAPPDIKLMQLSVGKIELDKGFMTAMVDVGTKIKIPVPAYVIQHPRGLVLFDTGMNQATADGNCANYWGQGLCGAFNSIQGRDEVVDRQLKAAGFDVSDVKYLSLIHI